MPIHLALVALLMSSSFGHPAVSRIAESHAGAWTLRVHSDPFRQRTTCRLTTDRVRYGRRSLVFAFSHRLDTSDAAYRVDDGQPMAANNDEMALARLGVAVHHDDLHNPSGGLVRIPEIKVRGARTVTIQIKADGPSERFKVDGLNEALTAAANAGCGSDSFE